jgi:hypothetical protein
MNVCSRVRMTKAVSLAWSVLLVAALAFAAAACGSGSSSPSAPSTGLTTNTFASEVVGFGGGRDFLVDVKGPGTLTAKVDWVQDGVPIGMYIVNQANSGQVLMDGGQTGPKQLTLSLPVSAGTYRIAVTNSSGVGPRVDTTFTLTVTHP